MTSDDKKIRHLDFIQLTITRMAANSFLLKAWSVTLVAGLFALASKDDSEISFIIIAYMPVIAFWILDAFYLHQEKLYRALYDSVRTKSDDDIDFDMNATSFKTSDNSWSASVMGRTLSIFYGTLLLVVLIVTFIVR